MPPAALKVILRALGIEIDPQQMMDAAKGAQQIVASFDAKLDAILTNQRLILEKLHERGLHGVGRYDSITGIDVVEPAGAERGNGRAAE